MTKDFGSQFSFSSGELSKNMWGRFDLPQYKSGCERLENFIVYPQGSVSFRDGFIFSSETKDNKIANIHKYHYKNEYFIFEYTDLALRIHDKDGVVTTSAKTINLIQRTGNAVNFRVTTSDYVVGQSVLFKDIPGCPELNNRMMKIDSLVGSDYNGTLEGSWASSTSSCQGGEVSLILEGETPFEEKDLFDLQFAQTATELFVTNNLYHPQEIVYLPSSNTLVISDFSPTGINFSPGNYPSAVTFFENRLYFAGTINGPQRLNYSKAGDKRDFTAGTNLADGGSYTLSSTDASVIKILSSTSKLLVIGTSGGTFGATTATPTSSFEVRPIDGFPVELINPIQKDNQVISVQAGARKLRSLNYSFQADGYVSNDLNIASEDITQGNIKQISYLEGSPEVIWCVKETGELIGLTYKPEVDVFAWHRHQLAEGDKVLSADSLTRDLDYEQLHIVVEREIDGRTVRTIERMADSLDYPILEDFYTGKNNIVSDTNLYKRTLLETQKGYIHLDGAFSYDGSQSNSLTLSALTGNITAITTEADTFINAEVGMLILQKNTMGTDTGSAVITAIINDREVECNVLVDFNSLILGSTEWYLTTNKVAGLNHLNGRTVRVIADGGVHPDRTVTGGSIDLEYQASVIHVGMGYTGLIKTTDINSIQFFNQTKPKNSYKFGIKLLDTIGLSYGTNIYRTERLQFRTANSLLNSPPELYTGLKDVTYSDGWNGTKNIVLLQEQSLPCTVLMVITYMVLGER